MCVLYVPSFQFNIKGATESGGRQDRSRSSGPNLAITAMVAQSITVDQRIMPSTFTSEIYSDTSTQTKQNVSTSQNETRTFSLIRKSLKNKGISKQARDIILGSWRDTKKRQYDGYIKEWIKSYTQSKACY
ncbi:hypothetical protein DPMN_082583 [Dreissena polymorpha]|uniref:Uncharacterized protein n=1 Tax=Dreissena polymorpha TaxID=45954 RepID=A0A9D3Y8D3_DREPO|nr:hypothetical protein DPMN_082583 [Dreissena polymorpha]